MEIPKLCLQIRDELDFDRLEPEQLLTLESHIRDCQDCALWRSQTSAMMSATRNFCEFDVPESVTQNILASVNAINAQERMPQLWVAGFLSLVGFVFLFRGEGVESAEGYGAWLMSVVILFGFVSLAYKNNASVDKKVV